MKAANFAWFVNGIQNASEQGFFTLPPCTIRGYQISMSAGSLDWGLWQTGAYAVFNFRAMLSDRQDWPSNLPIVGKFLGARQVAGTNQPPSTDPPPGQGVDAGTIVAVNAIVQEPTAHSNQSFAVPYGGLSIPVPLNSYLMFRLDHSGGKGALGLSLILYYDEG